MTRATARQRTFGTVAAVVGLLVLSACSGSDDDGAASAGGSEQDPDAQALVFAACMRDNGVDMPDPGPGQEGLGEAFQAVAGDYDQATLDRALSACEDLMPEYASEEQHVEGWELDLAECLREQGLDVSDNPFDDAHSGEVDVGEFSEAMEVCRDVLINGGR
ncbi:MAG: hypothetical protein ACRDZ1_14920 [Acidimicrobiia bacterium]